MNESLANVVFRYRRRERNEGVGEREMKEYALICLLQKACKVMQTHVDRINAPHFFLIIPCSHQHRLVAYFYFQMKSLEKKMS